MQRPVALDSPSNLQTLSQTRRWLFDSSKALTSILQIRLGTVTSVATLCLSLAPQSWKVAVGVPGDEKDKSVPKAKLEATLGEVHRLGIAREELISRHKKQKKQVQEANRDLFEQSKN